METKTEKYNGWTNRETWAAFTWLTGSDDESLYISALYCRTPQVLTDFVRELETLKDKSETLQIMFNDIGSLGNVNWKEIHDSLNEN